MKVTNFTRNALLFRRQEKKLLSNGFRRHETDWEIIRGGKADHIIAEAVISSDGKYVYTRLEKKDTP